MGKFARNKRGLLKEKSLQYLGGKRCFLCGVDHLVAACYDFHHDKSKDEEISRMIARGSSWKDLKAELDKCKILCKNCHAQLHYLRKGAGW